MPRPRERAPTALFGPNLPCVRGFMDSSVVTLPGSGSGGGEQPMLFDCWENGNEDVFSINTTGSPAQLISVDALVEGVYLIHFDIQLDNTPAITAGTNIGMCVEEGATFTESSAVVYPTQPLAGDNSSGAYSMTLVRGYPPVWMRCVGDDCAGAPCLPTWRFNAQQDDTIDHDAILGMFEIYLIGGLSVDTSELGP